MKNIRKSISSTSMGSDDPNKNNSGKEKKNSNGGKDRKPSGGRSREGSGRESPLRKSGSSKTLNMDGIEWSGLIHSKNEFLDICDYLIENPRVFREVVLKCTETFHIVDIVLMFHVRRLLYPAILCLLQLEVDENKKKGVEYETFRSETAAMLFVSAILGLDTLQVYKQNFVSECTVMVMSKISWNAKQLGKVVKEALKTLLETTNRMPEELIQVLKAFHATAPETEFQVSVFFLRYICPGLAQPQQAGGMDKVPPNLCKSLLNLAKALQLIANKVDPAEGTFAHSISKELRAQYALIEKIFEKINKGGDGVVSPPVTKSLSEPAVATFKLIVAVEKEPKEAERWVRFNDRLEPLVGTASSSFKTSV